MQNIVIVDLSSASGTPFASLCVAATLSVPTNTLWDKVGNDTGTTLNPLTKSALTIAPSLKGKSAVRIHGDYIKGRGNAKGFHFWSTGYCVSTVGLDEGKVREYIRHQERDRSSSRTVRLRRLTLVIMAGPHGPCGAFVGGYLTPLWGWYLIEPQQSERAIAVS